MTQKEFTELVQKILLSEKTSNIGSLSEKTLHKVVKNYLEENVGFHEVKVATYYADILKDGKITEIQTKQFNLLRNKLDCFLKDYQVEIVYPSYKRKYLNYLAKDTMEVISRRLSPKVGNIYEIFPELYKIKNYLLNPNLSLRIILFDLEEQKITDGKTCRGKINRIHYNRIPLEVKEEVLIRDISHYRIFIPEGLNAEFTSKDFKKFLKSSLRNSQIALNILNYLGIVERIGKIGHSYLYKLV